MNNKDNKRGFAGLSGLTSDIQISAQDSSDQNDQVPQQPPTPVRQDSVFALLELTKWPTLPAPWSSVDAGETWVWEDFFLTFQKEPKTVSDLSMEKQGKKTENRGIVYPYAMSVFYRIDRNPHGPSLLPIMTIALEQADLDSVSKMFGSQVAELLQTEGNGGLGPLMIGLFTGETRLNLGNYDGDTSPLAVKQRFFKILGRELGISGQPRMIGDLARAFGHQETGLPADNKNTDPPPPVKTMNAGKSSGGSRIRWELGYIAFFGVVSVISLVTLSAISYKNEIKVSSTSRSSSQSYNYPQNTPAPTVQTPNATQSAALEYTKPSVGTNNLLSVSEIRWCLHEQIRIEAMRDVVNTRAGIDELNRIVNDYNSRCAQHRSREGARSQAERAIESYKTQISEEAVREARKLGYADYASYPSASSGTGGNETVFSGQQTGPNDAISADYIFPTPNPPFDYKKWNWGSFRKMVNYRALSIPDQQKAWEHYKNVVIIITSKAQNLDPIIEQSNFKKIVPYPGIEYLLRGKFIIKTHKANIRQSATLKSPSIYQVRKGTTLEVIGFSGDFFIVVIPDNTTKKGFIHKTVGAIRTERGVESHRVQTDTEAGRETVLLEHPYQPSYTSASPNAPASNAFEKPDGQHPGGVQQSRPDFGYDPKPDDEEYARQIAEYERQAAEYERQAAGAVKVIQRGAGSLQPSSQIQRDLQARSNGIPIATSDAPENLSFEDQSKYSAAQRLDKLGYNVDWQTSSLAEMLEAESKISTANRLARLGHNMDWRTNSLAEMLDIEFRISTANRLKRKGILVDWQNYSRTQLLHMESEQN